MKQIRFVNGAGLAIALLASLAPLARADQTIDLERNQVVPVTLNDDLSFRNSRKGDRFSATVDGGYDLPRGTRLMGKVVGVHRRTDRQPAYLELAFDRMRLPDNSSQDIRAVPVSLDRDYVRRDRSGRYYGTDKVVDRDKAVLGGALAGIILGSIVHKPVEGAIIGAVAGVIIGQNPDSLLDDNVLRRGTRMGALFQRSVHVSYYGSDRRGDRGDWYDNRSGDRYGDWRNDRNSDRDQDYDDRYNDNNSNDRYYGDAYGRDDRNIRITYMGNDLRFSGTTRPFWQGRTLMVPLNRTADQLDLNVDSRGGDTYVVTDSDSNLRIEQGAREYRLNGRYGTLAVRVQDRNGITYVPLEILVQLKRDPVLLNGSRVRAED